MQEQMILIFITVVDEIDKFHISKAVCVLSKFSISVAWDNIDFVNICFGELEISSIPKQSNIASCSASLGSSVFLSKKSIHNFRKVNSLFSC